MSSGRTGTRVRSRPVASRRAATIAAVETTVGGSPTPFAPSGACGSGVPRADYLISGAIFSLPAPATGELQKVSIDMTVNREPTITRLQYRLNDAVALRNARRT